MCQGRRESGEIHSIAGWGEVGVLAVVSAGLGCVRSGLKGFQRFQDSFFFKLDVYSECFFWRIPPKVSFRSASDSCVLNVWPTQIGNSCEFSMMALIAVLFCCYHG